MIAGQVRNVADRVRNDRGGNYLVMVFAESLPVFSY